ncbi:MAG: hypothetical protein NTZ20_04345 [Candidatus Levybacteria bacterium]|nr:hypothetical protein [Candidatus Levybacteria bacterium]
MQYLLISVLFLIGLLTEAMFFQIPITLILLLLLFIFYKETWVFLLALISGIIIDIILVKTIGLTSIAYLSFLFIIILYEKKFEISSRAFIGYFCFFASIVICLILGYSNIIMTSVISSFIGMILYIPLIKKRLKEEELW